MTASTFPHWAVKFIGKPFEAGAQGPDKFDCWGLVRFIYAKRYGINLPEYPINHGRRGEVACAISETLAGNEWNRVYLPKEGDAAVMGGNSRLHHVGIWLAIDGGLVLHATKPTVTAQTLVQLGVRGLPHVQFYRHGNRR